MPRTRRRLSILVGFSLVVFLVRPVRDHLRAASFLLRFSDPATQSLLARSGTYEVEKSPFAFQDASGRTVPARLYRPLHRENPPGLVLLHGVHDKGIEEPRLQRFAETMAQSGLTVLTPELVELTDFRIEFRALETIGAAATRLHAELGTPPSVGVMGLSFAGGLALMAAADPSHQKHIDYVVAVGAHHSLANVMHFFVSNEAIGPSGRHARKAHDYGPLVFAYAHLPDFFSPEDEPIARAALRAWLGSRFDEAKEKAKGLSEPGRAVMESFFSHNVSAYKEKMLAVLETHRTEADRVSPHRVEGALSRPVFLLHGTGDDVIPATETEWLAQDLGTRVVKDSLVSPAISHVELSGKPTTGDRLRLVHFMAEVLSESENPTTKR